MDSFLKNNLNKIKSLLIIGLILNSILINAQYAGQHAAEIKVVTKIPVKAYSFDLQDIRLLDSRFKENMTREGNWLLALPNERLLHSFYVNAGMLTDKKSSKTKMPEPLGGWEGLDMELRGHSMGHILSGLALQYASTGDKRFKNKGDSLVAELGKIQNTLNEGGYLSAFPQNYIDRNIAGKSVWAPWYTLHKIFSGLNEMYWLAGNNQALEIETKMATWAYNKIKPLSKDTLALMLRNEFGGMNEAFYNLYSVTNNPQHLELAKMFYHNAVLNPLANEEDKLDHAHANTIIPKITGEARGYELTGDTKEHTIAEFFWADIVTNHTYAHGGNSDKEHFFQPGKISEHLTGYTSETCNTYNMLKVTRHLFTWDADEKYAEYYEQALYNHILGQQDPESGMVCYFTPMKQGAYKLYSTFDKSFWCCVGSGFESHSKYGEAIYYHDDKGVFINLFIPSELNWKDKNFKLLQENKFPEESSTTFTVQESGKENVSLYIRYPAWATASATITINGKKVAVNNKPGSYITLNKIWKKGDKIEVNYPMVLHWVPTPDNATKSAIAYGPILLAGKMGTEGMPAPFHNPSDPYEYYDYDYKIPSDLIHTLNAKNKNLNDVLKPVNDQPLTFITGNGITSKPITFRPYYDIHHERTVVYWDVQ